MIVEHNQSTYNGGQYENAWKFNGKELDDATGMYYYGARYYDPRISIFVSVDPLAEQTMEPYLYTGNNPIMFTDPTGMSKDDWVLGSEGIYWDNNATSQATTKKGDTYLGTELKFTFTSYIDKDLWDGTTMGGFIDPSGVKLTSSLTLTGKKNSAGELTSIASRFSSEPGPTPVGTARNFYPGEGGSNNYFNSSQTSTGVNFTFEQHASVSPIEESGLNARGFKIVDVAQKMTVDYNRSNGSLNIGAYTNIFPSANLTVKGNGNSNTFKMMQYDQPSFPATHTAPIKGYSPIPMREGVIGGRPIRDFSYYPSVFYKR